MQSICLRCGHCYQRCVRSTWPVLAADVNVRESLYLPPPTTVARSRGPARLMCAVCGRRDNFILLLLPARRIRKRGLCYGNVAGWVGVCLSHAGILSKRLNLSENFVDHLVTPSF